MKKILFAINHFRPSNGVAVALRNLVNNLDLNRLDISILPFYEVNPEFSKPVSDKVHFLKGFGFYFRGFDKIANLLPCSILYRLFVRERFDIEISFQYGIPTRCLAASRNPHRACWMHTFDLEMKNYYCKYPYMVTVSKVGTEKLIKAGFEESKCLYCYNIIDEDVINEKAKGNPPITRDHSIVVATVARMDPDKAYMRFAECIKKYFDDKNNNQDVEFWFIGGGSEESKVRDFVKQSGLESHVKVLGKQTNPYQFLARADLYFCASYREGFSTSCQEAALLGIPVVSVAVDGAKELVEDSECGAVIGNDENSICGALRNIMNDQETIRKWKETAVGNKSKFYKQSRIRKVSDFLDII